MALAVTDNKSPDGNNPTSHHPSPTPTHTNNINMFAWAVFVLNIMHAYIRRESERKHTEERKRKRTRQEKTGQVASQPLLTATLRIRNRREVRGREEEEKGGGEKRRYFAINQTLV